VLEDLSSGDISTSFDDLHLIITIILTLILILNLILLGRWPLAVCMDDGDGDGECEGKMFRKV
jgi:hypothetical protein